MSVNGITSKTTTEEYSSKSSAASKQVKDATPSSDTTNTAGVIYEPSTNNVKTAAYSTKQNAAIIAQLKADAEQRTAQLQSLVEQMFGRQGNCYGQATDMWQFLASGNYTVDAATKAQAQADIAEDGYWGISKTSDRIFDFAKALSGGDPEKIEEMRKAVEKGFKEATGAWGKELPSISKSTYNAVMDKFDKYAEDNKTVS